MNITARTPRAPDPTSPWIIAGVGIIAAGLVVAVSWNRSRLYETDRWWAIAATVAVAIIVHATMPRAQQLLPTPGALPAAVGATLIAVYGCVPETDQIPAVALTVGALAIIEVLWRHPVWVAWHSGVALLVLWAGVYGATGRQSALVGALFAWWPVVLVPLIAAAWPPLRQRREPWRWLIMLIGAAGAVAVARTGALEPTGAPALITTALFAGTTLAIALGIAIASTPVTARRAVHRS